jgi:ribosomal protein S18 acetylase RimI-like enzyme
MDRNEAFHVRRMARDEVDLAVEWAAQEGWNPGLHDAACFWSADPNGFFVGQCHGEPVACISAVTYGEDFGFIGLYIVKPAFRGRGFGLATWQHAMTYLGGRTIGLDGVVAQQPNYRKSGFGLLYRNIRFQGVVQAASAPSLVDARDVDLERLIACDRDGFGAPRAAFVQNWIAQPDAVALAQIAHGRVGGYAVMRRCRAGRKIGPLFAEGPDIAQALFDGLAANAVGEVISLDVPEVNPAAVALAERHGMTRAFETARMYRGDPPSIDVQRVFGVTSFELG